MSMPERRNLLLEMKAELAERLEKAQADFEAVERLLAMYDEMSLPEAATVEQVRLAAIEALDRNGEPMHRQVLLLELEDAGVRVGGKKPVANLGSILSRFSTDFKPHGNGVWGLKGWAASPKPAEPSPLENGSTPDPCPASDTDAQSHLGVYSHRVESDLIFSNQ